MRKTKAIKKITKRKNGITLIALVITIIVLLILAGISISMIAGDNGILKKAGDAKDKSDEAAAREQIQMEVLGSYTTDNLSLDKALLKTNLQKIGAEVTESATNIVVKLDGYRFQVDDKGNVIRTNNEEKSDTPELTIGDYICYDVTYKDIYTSSGETAYGKNNGWRLLNKTQNANETYDIEIISTGIPAGLHYNPSYIKNARWAGNDTQRATYHNEFYVSKNSNEANMNMYAAAGMYYNFKDITFKRETNQQSIDNKHYNYGYYTEINGKTDDEIYGIEFLTPGVALPTGVEARVRALTLSDIYPVFTNTDYITIDGNARYAFNDDSGYGSITTYTTSAVNTTDKALGLFKLDDYSKDPHNKGGCWLASPYTGNTYRIWIVNLRGEDLSADSGAVGIRPVVSISGVKLIYDDENKYWTMN